MARELGVGEERADLLPADKVTAIAELDARHGPTGMVGDGVNDAPALAAAKVSIALGGISSGAALESADIVLLADDLGRLPWLIRLSRATLARIRQNITIALVTKVVVLVLAVFGTGQPLDGHRRRRRHQSAGDRQCAAAVAGVGVVGSEARANSSRRTDWQAAARWPSKMARSLKDITRKMRSCDLRYLNATLMPPLRLPRYLRANHAPRAIFGPMPDCGASPRWHGS